MKKSINKITEKEEKYIRNHTNLTVSEIAGKLGITAGKIYYFVKKNNIHVKPAKNSVKEFFEKMEE